MLVMSYHFLELVYARVEDVTVHCKAVRCPLFVWENCTTEPKQVDLLICVVELQNAANLVNDLQVLILLHVPVVERIRVIGRSI